MAASAGKYSASLNYLNEITADEITVIFNGTTYTVPKRTRTLPNEDVHSYYGTLGLLDNGDATGEYPFCIYVAQGLNTVYVSTDVYDNHNPFTIKIMEEAVTTTPCFEKAVQKVAPPTDISPLILTQSGSPVQLDRTFGEISNAYLNGRTVLLDPASASKSYYSMVSLTIDNAPNPQSGGRIVFGGETTRAFSASSASDYPVLVTT